MRYLFTGSPCSGKSSVFEQIHYLDKVPEVARQWLGFLANEELMDTYSRAFIQNLIEITQVKNFVDNPYGIFDRGLVDEIAYRRYFGMEVSTELREQCLKYRYDKVFLFPFWGEIYTNDEVRKETFEEAEKLHHLISAAYVEFGYQVIDVPKIAVEERIAFIKKNIFIL